MQGTRQDVGRGNGAAVAAAAAPDTPADPDGDSSSRRGGGTSESGDGFLQDRGARHIYISRMIERAASRGSGLAASTDEGAGSGGEEGLGPDKGTEQVPRRAQEAAEEVKEDAVDTPRGTGAADASAVNKEPPGEAPVVGVEGRAGVAAAPAPAASGAGAALQGGGGAGPVQLAPGGGLAGVPAAGGGMEGLRPDGGDGSGGLNAAALAQYLGGVASGQSGLWPHGMVLQPAQLEAMHAAMKHSPGQQVRAHCPDASCRHA